MTKEDKQLLTLDLCGRLPYRKAQCEFDLKGYLEWNQDYKEEFEKAAKIRPNLFKQVASKKYTLYGFPCWDRVHFLEFWGDNDYGVPVEYVKPYLRPMSSMTEEERDFYNKLAERPFNIFVNPRCELVDWLNENDFDYRNLIEKGLANIKE